MHSDDEDNSDNIFDTLDDDEVPKKFRPKTTSHYLRKTEMYQNAKYNVSKSLKIRGDNKTKMSNFLEKIENCYD